MNTSPVVESPRQREATAASSPGVLLAPPPWMSERPLAFEPAEAPVVRHCRRCRREQSQGLEELSSAYATLWELLDIGEALEADNLALQETSYRLQQNLNSVNLELRDLRLVLATFTEQSGERSARRAARKPSTGGAARPAVQSPAPRRVAATPSGGGMASRRVASPQPRVTPPVDRDGADAERARSYQQGLEERIRSVAEQDRRGRVLTTP